MGRWYDRPRYRPAVVPRTAIGLLVGLLLATACGDDGPDADDRRADQVGGAATDAGLPEEVVTFLADAAAADGTYRVAYDVADPEGGPPQRLTITQRPPDRRIDVEAADGRAEATIGTADGTQACTRAAADEPWRCEPVAGAAADGAFDPEVVAALAESLAADAGSYDFAVEDRTVLGVAVRCLVTTLRAGIDDPALGGTGTLCTSAEGARLLTETPSGTLRAVEYTTSVEDDAFVPPDAAPGNAG
jgi:hypothetical protein